jgi:hypothetical protein
MPLDIERPEPVLLRAELQLRTENQGDARIDIEALLRSLRSLQGIRRFSRRVEPGNSRLPLLEFSAFDTETG